MKRFIVIIAVLICSYARIVSAHEHWVDTETFYPVVGKERKIFICSGHGFPESSIVLKDRVLHNTEITKPDRTTASYEAVEDGKRRSGNFTFDSPGTYVVGFTLKQPQMKEPMFRAKSIVVAGGRDDNEKLYSLGKGLEIVPGSKISTIRKGDKLPLTVLYDGVRVNAFLSILPEQGKSLSLGTTSERAASLSISKAGRYLVTTSYRGKSCSLTFAVQKAGIEK